MEEFLPKKSNSADYNHVLEKLQDYILTKDNIRKSLESIYGLYNNEKGNNNEKMKENDKNMIDRKGKHTEKENDKKEKIYIPKEVDTLFWCFYIIKFGMEEYNNLTAVNIVVEKKFKIDYVTKIRQNKQLIRKFKLATLTHIEDKLVNEQKIDIKTFFALCVTENINILYIHKKTFFELNINETKPYIIHHLDNKYGYEEIKDELNEDLKDTENKINFYKTHFFQITSIDKPIKSMSYYKVDELVEICKKIGIECQTSNSKIKNKKELYEAFLQYL